MPGSKQAWPTRRGLLIADKGEDGQRALEDAGFRRAVIGGGVAHLRQQGAGDAEERQQPLVPGLAMDVEEQAARGVGGVGRMDAPAGQPPEQEAVDGADGKLARRGALARLGHILQQPGDLGRGEIGIEEEAGQALDHRALALGLQPAAEIGAAPVLPDDGVVDRLAARPLPHDRGLALIGDADGRHIGGGGQHLAADGQGRLPDLLRVMLDPAVGREDLRQLALRHGADMAFAVEDDGARAGRALIDRQNAAARHDSPLDFRDDPGRWGPPSSVAEISISAPGPPHYYWRP